MGEDTIFYSLRKANKYFVFDKTENLDSYLRIGVDPTDTLIDFHYRVFKHLYPYLNIYTKDSEAIKEKNYPFEDECLRNFHYFFVETQKGASLYYTIKLRNTWGTSEKGPLGEAFHKDDGNLPNIEQATLDDLLARIYPQEPEFTIVYGNLSYWSLFLSSSNLF